MFKSITLGIVILFVTTSNTRANNYGTTNFTPQNCPGVTMNAQIVSITVDPCQPYDEGGCILERGGSTTVEIKFIPDKNITHLGHKVHGKKGSSSAKLPFNKIPRDACTLIREGCPLIAGQQYTYFNSIPIQTYYPQWEVLIEYDIFATNPRKRQLFKLACFRLLTTIE